MGKDDRKRPRFKPDIDAFRIDKKESDDNDMPIDKVSIPPLTAGFIDSIGFQDDEESAQFYKASLRRALGLAGSLDEEEHEMNGTPNLQAPFLSGADAGGITPEQIVAGVYINIPRSNMLWAGDQIKLIWGTNTFYTTLESKPFVAEPRLVQYINCEQLADYQNGDVSVHYEVVRRSRLVGISDPLAIYLEGNGRPRSGPRRRSTRRRGY